MRQAGRYLPEYRALKAKHSFLEMVRTPELAREVTLQPLRRFPLDAAILFSDILTIPEALGLGYRFKEEGGIAMEWRIESGADLARLARPEAVRERLAYVAAALRLLRAELGGRQALLGFAGSPWTLAAYMVEGGGSETFGRLKAMFHAARADFERLAETLTEATIAYLRLQIEAGADAVQIFDSWAGIVAAHHYEAASLRWLRRIVAALPADFPVILYAKGAGHHAAALAATGARVLGLDWTVDLATVRRGLPPGVAVQGNLDPALLSTTPDIVRAEARRLLESMRALPGHIFNLGHGIQPDARPENMSALGEAIVAWKN